MDDQNGRDGKAREARQEAGKHRAAMLIENNIAFLQRRAWSALLSHAYNALESEEKHRIPRQRLAKRAGDDSDGMD